MFRLLLLRVSGAVKLCGCIAYFTHHTTHTKLHSKYIVVAVVVVAQRGKVSLFADEFRVWQPVGLLLAGGGGDN